MYKRIPWSSPFRLSLCIDPNLKCNIGPNLVSRYLYGLQSDKRKDMLSEESMRW
jgi:hypothetical protein